MSTLDAITTDLSYADLLDLRARLQVWSADLSLSDRFRELCDAAVCAIGQCSEADPETHPAVVDALEQLNLAALEEAAGVAARDELFAQLDAAQDAAGWRRILGDLLPLLSDAHVLGLRVLMLDAAADLPASVSVN